MEVVPINKLSVTGVVAWATSLPCVWETEVEWGRQRQPPLQEISEQGASKCCDVVGGECSKEC